jgi:hypothetical protein
VAVVPSRVDRCERRPVAGATAGLLRRYQAVPSMQVDPGERVTLPTDVAVDLAAAVAG